MVRKCVILKNIFIPILHLIPSEAIPQHTKKKGTRLV